MTHPVICQECHEIFDANNSTSRLRHHEGETHVRACIQANQKILLNRWDLKEDKKKGRR
jgi:hypothetical protein